MTTDLYALAERAAIIYRDAYRASIVEGHTVDEAHEDAAWALQQRGIHYREDYEPGVYIKGGQMYAWTWDPKDIGADDRAWDVITKRVPLNLP